MVIADSNVWIDYFNNRKTATVQALADLIKHRTAAIIGVVLTEITRGARTAEQMDELKLGLEGVRYLEMTKAAWERAGAVGRTLDAQGTSIPLADMIIGAFALEHGHEVLTRDRHLQRIPGLRLYRPRGTA